MVGMWGLPYYRTYVGPPWHYDLVSAMQFSLLAFLGLRESHFLLDVGCGSLRGGRLFIPYLLPGRYYGIEPDKRLVEGGIRNELGDDLIAIKRPVFSYDDSFRLSMFDRTFDFILAQSIFSHASQRQIQTCLSEARKVMSPTSLFAATFFQGERNYTGSKWVYPGLVTYTFKHMRSLVAESGLICKQIDWPHPSGQTWIVIANPENEENIPDLSNIAELMRLKDEMRFYNKGPCVKLCLKIRGFPQRTYRWMNEQINEWRR